MTRWALLLGTLLLCGCSADADGQGGTGTGPSVEVDLPEGWRPAPDEVEPPVVLAARGPTPEDDLAVSVLEGAKSAQQQAAVIAVALADSRGIYCRPREDADLGTVLDCPDRTRRPWMHKVLVPLAGDGASALVLVQTRADSYAEAAAVVAPIVGSLVWR